ncbi:hypothetical protein D9M71_607520 [compost metagenome]
MLAPRMQPGTHGLGKTAGVVPGVTAEVDRFAVFQVDKTRAVVENPSAYAAVQADIFTLHQGPGISAHILVKFGLDIGKVIATG